MRFFFDNCISPNIVEALVHLDSRHHLKHLRAKFEQGISDPDWIRRLGQEGNWIIISGDPRISRGQAERAAWIESGLTAFFLGDAWQNRRLMKQASELLGWWDDIVDRARNAPKGAGYMLDSKQGLPRQIYPLTTDPKRGKKKPS